MKRRIMIFCDSYLPGYKGGGGMWAVHNLADQFKDEFDFFIVTRDCDGKLDQTPFVRAARDKWNDRPEAKVFYASPAKLNRKAFQALVTEIEPNLIYLNSVFSYVCAKFLLTRRKAKLNDVPLILAPCGEFSAAAIGIKSAKKRSFLAFARLSGLFDGVIWKASATDEALDIEKTIGESARIENAPELAPTEVIPDFAIEKKVEKIPGEVRLIYFSRITPKKNLLFILNLLNKVSTGSLSLDIVGPSDDPEYLEQCEAAGKLLPENISVNFKGGKRYEVGLQELFENHFMVFPTQNENFGYVIIESLAAGTPVLSSDQISWSEAKESAILSRISLDDPDAWIAEIERCIAMNSADFIQLSLSARQFAVEWLSTNESVSTFRALLNRSIDRNE
jgi:glycosyltransferase involved in cell wall biosynthesis